MFGWLIAKNINAVPKTEGTIHKYQNYYLFTNFLNKFPEDRIEYTSEEMDCLFDGYIYDKSEVVAQSGQSCWKDACIHNFRNQIIPEEYRGAFCGYVMKHASGEIIAYTDHTGNKPAFYYCDKDRVLISSNLNYIAQVMKKEKIQASIDENAVKYLLTVGSMLDDSTIIRNVKRILPGHMVVIRDGIVENRQYYNMNHIETQEMSEEEAIERLDKAFRNAIRREFEKDSEYGYRHLVDLSGGMDSRMVCWVAHDMGYTDQVNFTYSKGGYLDHTIAEKVALHLKHSYLFMPLDDVKWLYDLDEIVEKNMGTALYNGITGGNRFLSLLNMSHFGIEHTGIGGDTIPSSSYTDESEAYGKPKFGKKMYSEMLKFDYNPAILDGYKNQEIFTVFTRIILGTTSSYIIRQNYVEASSPFLDVDFLNISLSLPFEYRKKHNIYLKWINTKYPEATEFGWEKWGGVKPKPSHIWLRRLVTLKRLAKMKTDHILGKEDADNMNPIEYWYAQDISLQNYYNGYFKKAMAESKITEQLKKDMEYMFQNGNATEKGMVLTVLAAEKQYCEVSKL